MEAAVVAQVDEVVKEVLKAPGPSPQSVLTDLYGDAGNVPL
jgi:hypothetical protein